MNALYSLYEEPFDQTKDIKFDMMQTSQTHRKKLEKKYKDLIEANKNLNRKVVSFQANKNTPFYSWFAYKEGFYSQMVKMFLRDYPKKTGRVLDPFSGYGATLFASKESPKNNFHFWRSDLGELWPV